MTTRASLPIARSTSTPIRKTRATPEARTKKGHSYRSLPKEFRHHGFTYRQIARENDAVIYEQTWNGCAKPSLAYELIRIRRRDAFQIDGRFIEAAEIYPRSEHWGADGWTFVSRKAAFEKLREVCK